MGLLEGSDYKPIVDTFNIPAIIAIWPTGVIYTNQTGGVSCNHPSVEGFLIPVDLDGKVWDTCMSPPSPKEIQEIEYAVCRKYFNGDIRNFKVIDHPDNEEAWIRCEFEYRYTWSSTPADWTRFEGILTYENCD